MPSHWDVFHSDRPEVERNLTTEAVRQALARGSVNADDLIRPAGSAVAWTPLLDIPQFQDAAGPSAGSFTFADDDDEPIELELAEPDGEAPAPLMAEIVDDAPPEASFEFADDDDDSMIALPAVPANATPAWDDAPRFEDDDAPDPLEEDEEAAEFTLARSGPETIEELDLAAMVDVAFQLVLFFLVTATTVLYKSLEVPRPNADAPPQAATQGRGKSLDDLKSDFILVEIDAAGAMKLDHEPLPGDVTLTVLADRLRTARKDTDRQAMLLSADFATPHRNAVLAYDAANEIGLRIAIAKPTGNPGPGDGGNNPPLPVRVNGAGGAASGF